MSGISFRSCAFLLIELMITFSISFNESYCTVDSIIVIMADNFAFGIPLGLLWYLGMTAIYVVGGGKWVLIYII